MLTDDDNISVRKALNAALRAKVGAGSDILEDKLVRTLNLMDSWPSNLPLNILNMDPMGKSKHLGENRNMFETDSISRDYSTNSPKIHDLSLPSIIPWCGMTLPPPHSEKLCNVFGLSTLSQPATFVNQGSGISCAKLPLLYYLVTLPLGYKSLLIVPPANNTDYITTSNYIVGGDNCAGRCGKLCIGAGLPDNHTNIYTRACYNHDICIIEHNGDYIDPRCNWMFIFAITDFLYGDPCSVAPTIVSPNQETINPTNGTNANVTFKWKTNFPGATGFDLEISSQSISRLIASTDCSQTGNKGWERDCNYTVNNLSPNSYIWSISPVYGDGSFGQSATANFIISGSTPSGTRFKDMNDGTMFDTATGLMWTKDGAPTTTSCTSNGQSYDGAFTFVQCLNNANYARHSDWQLPNISQLASLCNKTGDTSWLNAIPTQNGIYCNGSVVYMMSWLYSQGYTNVHQWYWSSTVDQNGYGGVWYGNMLDGYVNYTYEPVHDGSVWPVRSGQ